MNAACTQNEHREPIQVGTPAPDFSLEAAQGGTYSLAALKGQVVLLSFLNAQAEVSADNPDMSRSQVVFLRSMLEQYGPKGMQVLIVDAAYLATGTPSSQDDLVNYTYDWHLQNIPLLMDKRNDATARAYDVTQAPTTLLINTAGIVTQRWDTFASAQDLAFALQVLVGKPIYREDSN